MASATTKAQAKNLCLCCLLPGIDIHFAGIAIRNTRNQKFPIYRKCCREAMNFLPPDSHRKHSAGNLPEPSVNGRAVFLCSLHFLLDRECVTGEA
jgi:hypothetical protein